MSQKYATQKDVDKIISHIVNMGILDNLGLHETRLFTFKREKVSVNLLEGMNFNRTLQCLKTI